MRVADIPGTKPSVYDAVPLRSSRSEVHLTRLRIVQLITKTQRRGAETFAVQLGNHLEGRGHEVVVVSLAAGSASGADDMRHIVELGSARTTPCRLLELSRLIQVFRPSLVQANGSATLKYGVLARALGGNEWPIVYRNISIGSSWIRNQLHGAWVRWLYRQTSHVAAVSERSREDLIGNLAMLPERVTTIPIGTQIPNLEQIASSRRLLETALQIPQGGRLLVHVGAFSPEKDHGTLLEAFQRIAGMQLDLHLVLIGDGPLRREVERSVPEQLAPRIHFLGSRADAAELLGGADVVVLSSTIEGLPGVLLEAAARARAIVATDVGGIPEIVDHGRTGLLIPARDPQALSAAISVLLNDDALRARMGSAGRELVLGSYDMPTVADAFESLYYRLAATHG
jgi:L-malate glycosyltransferase